MAVKKNKTNTVSFERLPSIEKNHNTTRLKKAFSVDLFDTTAPLPCREGRKGRGKDY
jgi:hypothetical protein